MFHCINFSSPSTKTALWSTPTAMAVYLNRRPNLLGLQKPAPPALFCFFVLLSFHSFCITLRYLDYKHHESNSMVTLLVCLLRSSCGGSPTPWNCRWWTKTRWSRRFWLFGRWTIDPDTGKLWGKYSNSIDPVMLTSPSLPFFYEQLSNGTSPGVVAFYIRKGHAIGNVFQDQEPSSPTTTGDTPSEPACFLDNSFVKDELDDQVAEIRHVPVPFSDPYVWKRSSINGLAGVGGDTKRTANMKPANHF